MTRKDFVLIADTIVSLINNQAFTGTNDEPVVHVADVIAEFAEALKLTNDRFDSARFVTYVEKGAGL